MCRLKFTAIAMLSACVLQASAVEVTASLSQVSEIVWQMNLAMTNDDGVPASIREFTLWFPENQFADLSIVASPVGWDSIVAQPDVILASFGFFDSLATGSGLELGQSQSGFSLRFSYLGQGAPTAGMAYQVVDPSTLTVTAQGVTLPAATSVPEPASSLQLVIGLAAIGMTVVRRKFNRRGGA